MTDFENKNISLGQSDHGLIVDFGDKTTMSDVFSLLEWLPLRFELRFFDQFYPSPSDPGAYVSIQRNDKTYAYFMGNHGWSSGWKQGGKLTLADWIYKNIGAKDPFQDKIYPVRIMKARGGPKPGS